MSNVRLILGDCLEVMKGLDAGSVDAVVTDPPYGVDVADWDDKVPYELLSQMLRVSRGPVVWFGAAPLLVEQARTFDPSPERTLIWSPKFTLSHTQAHGLYYRWHPIYCWRLPSKITSFKWDILQDNTECGNWWKFKCTKPVSLMEKLVGIVEPGGIILDPFMGSGSTAVACIQTGRNFIGCDNDSMPYAIAERRIAEAQLQMRLPLGG